MTDLKNRLALLLTDEPDAPDDLDRIVGAGRRARRRRNAALAVAGAAGAAGLTAAVVVPIVASGGSEPSFSLGTKPQPSPSPTTKCYLISAPGKDAKLSLAKLYRSGKIGPHMTVKQLRKQSSAYQSTLEVCSLDGLGPSGPTKEPQPAAGPPYTYTEKPDDIAARLSSHLHDRVTGFGLTITYVRAFAQEASKLEGGHPSYFDGNVDVHEANGYADIGVQVTHATTEFVPFDGDCTAASHCAETKLPDGSVLRTGEAKAGQGMIVLTAEVHRPDGVVVQAQMSNYPFGPDAGSQPHGDQPLTMDQLVSLAEDAAFSF